MYSENKNLRLFFTIVIISQTGLLSGCSLDRGDEQEAFQESDEVISEEDTELPKSDAELASDENTIPSSPTHPFPQHVTYAPNTIIPNHVSPAEMAQEVESFYDDWKTARLRDDCGGGSYYVYMGEATGGSADTISTSEGHGYGMIITALMAGYDPQAQTIFDGLYQFFREHPSVNSPDLMAWNQVEGCEDVEPDNTGSAVDGDMDIAYALLLADRQWGSDGAINYQAEAISVINAILEHEINPETSIIMLGDWVTPDEPEYYYGTRSSDFMPGHLRAYYQATGDDVWLDVLEANYSLYEDIQARYSPETGLLPDFIQNTNTTPQPAEPYYLEDDTDGWYYYNACRDPWRIGVDVLYSGDPGELEMLSRMNTWMQAATDGDPANIHAGYDLTGMTGEDYDYIDMAFIAPLGVSAMVEADNQQWLNDLWDFAVNHPFEDEQYFDSTLKLLSMIVMSGNWWVP